MRGALPTRELVPYWVSQLVGACAAAFLTYKFTGFTLHVAPDPSASVFKALLGEAVFTFALAYVVLHTATTKATSGNSYFGLAIGSTVMVGAFAMGGISGGAFNPAVGLGPAIVEGAVGHGFQGAAWIYLVGPLAGAAVAAWVYKFQNGDA